jgi:hypothetical protein
MALRRSGVRIPVAPFFSAGQAGQVADVSTAAGDFFGVGRVAEILRDDVAGFLRAFQLLQEDGYAVGAVKGHRVVGAQDAGKAGSGAGVDGGGALGLVECLANLS